MNSDRIQNWHTERLNLQRLLIFLIKLRRLSWDDERIIVIADIVNYKAVRVYDPKAY